MLKVNTNKGKFDIVLNEENLVKTDEGRHRVVKGRQSSKGFSSQAHRLPPKTSRLKQNEKTKPIPKSQTRDTSNTRLTKNQSRKDQASDDAGYVTKDQLSRILLSLQASSEGQALHSPPHTQGPVRVEHTSEQTSVNQPLIRGNQQSSSTELKTEQNTLETSTIGNHAEDQVNISNKNKWKKELDQQIAMKETLRAKRNMLENEVEEYDPWGRPGGGAPVRTKSGSVVADYKKMHQDMFSKNDSKMTSVSATDLKHFVTTTTESGNTHNTVTTTVPVAMRSSFAVGAPGVVKYESYQSKIDEKKKWLQELEQQIKEKKEREAQDKLQQSHKEAREESWNQAPVKSPSPSRPTVASRVAVTNRESPLNAGASVVLENSFRAGNFHTRGHGLQSLADINQDEFERKRLKTLEHQLAIKEQVEEKRRLKQEEKERRLKEEAEKEEALKLERERLQKEYKDELKQRQEKEDETRRRAEALQLSIQQAYESAQQEKSSKRIKHLELGGHDVSGLRSPGLGPVQQQQQQHREDTDTSPHKKEADLSNAGYNQLSPRGTQEAPTCVTVSSATHQPDASFESELKELSLKASLESEWTSSSPRNNSQAKSHLKSSPSPVHGADHTKTRSQSQRSQRKKQAFKQRNKRQSSLDNCLPGEKTVSAVPPPLEDAFMIPYTRSTSATFSAVPATPLTDPAANDRSKQTLKKPISQAHRTTVSSLSQKSLGHRQTVRKDNMARKESESPRGRQRVAKQDLKKGGLSRTAEIRKADKSITQEHDAHAVQASPERLPTARQEMILQQLAALRQGLMMKERELHHGIL